MSRRSLARDRYKAQYLEPAVDAAEYLNKLNQSPFKTHARVYQVLKEVPSKLQKQKESMEFAEKLKL